jgi:hypothetical protein
MPEARMTSPPSDFKSRHLHVLDKARELAAQVRQTAERVHEQAVESHRLTEIARKPCKRGRELSKSGREGARSVNGSVRWSLETALQAERRLAGKDEC